MCLLSHRGTIVPYRGKRDETINLNTFHDILVSGAGDQTVKLWAKGAEVATLCGHTDYVGAAVSFDS